MIPAYVDPHGTYNHGVPTSYTIGDTGNPTVAAFDSALQYMQAHGGTIIEHGDTHQFSDVDNPYNGTTGDDFEFYAAHCSTTQGGPLDRSGSCPNTDWVVQDGPVPGTRRAGRPGGSPPAGHCSPRPAWCHRRFGRPPTTRRRRPTTPAIDATYALRYEREQFSSGALTPGASAGSHVFGQFYPYVVHDLYGTTIVPEDLANYEPTESNNNPPKPASYIIGNAAAELAVRQGVASFFFHPYYDVNQLAAIVTGIKALGYTFVTPGTLLGGSAPTFTSPATLAAGTVGQAYSSTLTTAGGRGASVFRLVSATLPAGLSLNAQTGRITGTPTTAGDNTFLLQAADTTGLTSTQSATMHVNAPAVQVALAPTANRVGTTVTFPVTVSCGPTFPAGPTNGKVKVSAKLLGVTSSGSAMAVCSRSSTITVMVPVTQRAWTRGGTATATATASFGRFEASTSGTVAVN